MGYKYLVVDPIPEGDWLLEVRDGKLIHKGVLPLIYDKEAGER